LKKERRELKKQLVGRKNEGLGGREVSQSAKGK